MALRCSELMIGDWVGFLPTWKNEDGSIGRDGDPNDPIPFKVEMVFWNCVVLNDKDGSSFDADDISLYPIPLTLEILEKNGFKVYNRYIWEQRDNYCRVRLNIAPKIEIDGEIFGESPILLQIDGATFSLNIIIEYVHELQHALRLCGIEKEIEL